MKYSGITTFQNLSSFLCVQVLISNGSNWLQVFSHCIPGADYWIIDWVSVFLLAILRQNRTNLSARDTNRVKLNIEL